MDKIHMIGYDAVHPDDFLYDVPTGHAYWLLILTNTPARFWQDGDWRECPAHHAALFPPHAAIRYGACAESYGNDWVIFSSDEAYVTRFPLMATPFPVLDADYCHNLFQLLTWEHAQDCDETVVSQLMSVLFHKLREGIGQSGESDYRRELLALRRRISNHPREAWSVAGMAARLHISAGYLQLLYKRQFGVSCIDDVIQSRVRLAKDYLAHTSMRISEIASLCGYNSTEHFSRQFRKLCGMAPGQFRRKAGGEPDA